MNELDAQHIDDLYARELARFTRERPRSLALHEQARAHMPSGVPMAWMAGLYAHPPLFVAGGAGTHFTDVDGHRYLDMNQADMSMACGFGPEPVVRAVSAQVARGSQFLLPTEDAIAVSSLLAERFGLPFWQYTLSASAANTEVIRLARLATGRRKILRFEGSYHGHIDDTLAGTPHDRAREARHGTLVAPFNDLGALESALAAGEIACVITEPALTNINVVLPDDGFHEALRKLTAQHGTLLVIDETHTHICAYGGLTRAWKLAPDIFVVGKAIAGGVPMGTYGITAELAALMERELEVDQWPAGASGHLAVGGTLFGNPLSMAAARAALEEILTPEGHARVARLGAQLSDGIEGIVRDAALPWTAHRLSCRSGVCYAPRLPRNAAEAVAAANFARNRLHRVFLANRGVWEAIGTAGPAVSFAATQHDIAHYLGVFEELVRAMCRGASA